MPIYTKTGDKGKTSLFDGTRVAKNNIRVEAYGNVDELNTVLGIIIAQNIDVIASKEKQSRKDKADISKLKNELIQIQHDLFEIGAILANPREKVSEELQTRLQKQVAHFENYIDAMTAQMPELMNFILPGGGRIGALLQFARAVSRRVERRVVELSQKEQVENAIIIYFNRLSDLLFTMSRYANFLEEKKEIIWVKSVNHLEGGRLK